MTSTPTEPDIKFSRHSTSPSADIVSIHPSLARGPPVHARAAWGSLFAFTQRTHARVLLAAIVAAGAVAALRTGLSIFLGRVFDIVAQLGGGLRSGQSAFHAVSRWCLVLVGLGLGNWLANAAFLAMWILFGELQADSARRLVFQALLTRELAWFDMLDHGSSGLLFRIQTQTRDLQAATSQVLGFLVCDVLTSCASLAVALYYSWRIALVLIASLPLSVVVLTLATRPLDPAIQAQKAHLEEATRVATASVTAIDLVKVFGGVDGERRRYVSALGWARRHYLVQARCNSIQVGYMAFWVVAMFVLGFWYGNILVGDGLPPGHVVTTFYSTLAAFQGFEALLPHWLVLSKGMSAGSFLLSIAAKPEDSRPEDSGDASRQTIRLEHCVGDVQFSNVSFAYPSNPAATVLDASCLAFPAGQTTFIVGRSGSGKSTVGSLLTKLYKPLSGQIYIDGQPIGLLDDVWVRENVTLVQQSSVLFSDSLLNNIALGHMNPDRVTPEEVRSACQVALLQSTLASLPRGLDTLVGPHGFELSGGQKQKIALARARLRNPTVLILDEVTSGIDQVGRALVMDALRDWRSDKTTIIITHDMSNVCDNDYVYVMDNARVVQQGFKRDLPDWRHSVAAPLHEGLGPHSESIKKQASRLPVNLVGTPRGNWTALSSRSSQSPSGHFLSRIMQHSRPVSRSSLGFDAAHALSIRLQDKPGFPPSSQRPVLGDRATTLFEAERRHFSAFVNSKFFPPPEKDPSGDGRQSPANNKASGKSLFGEADEPVVDYIFGASERRENISELRLRVKTLGCDDSGGEPPLASLVPKEKASLLSIVATLWPTLGKANRAFLILGLVACLVGAVATPAFAYCLAQLMSVLWSPGNKTIEGQTWALRLLVVAVTDGLSTGSSHYLMERVGQSWADGVRSKAIARILQQPKAWFDDAKHSPGRITECLERNAEEMRNVVGRFVPIVVAVATILSISLTWALITSWRLTLVALAPLPIVFATVKGFTTVASEWESKCNVAAEDCSAVMTETLLNLRAVRALTLEAHFDRRHRHSAKRTLSLGLSRAMRTSWLYGMYQSMSYALTALVFYYSTSLLAQDAHANVASVVQVVNLLLFSIGTSSEILNGVPQLAMAQAAAAPLLRYASLPLDRSGREQAAFQPESPLPVRMRDLAFSYTHRAADMVLNGVSLDIMSGECTVVVGESGCGKSTMAALLLGLRTPSEPPNSAHAPSLSFAGFPCSDVDLQRLRSTMAYVPQSPFLFPTTVAENIAYGLAQDSPHRRSESIAQAAQAAGLHDFIASLPQGYNTVVGDGGLALSGGQAQRLSIARALARRPRLLVMDEPTSALDADSARTVRHTIRRLVYQARRSPHGMAVVLVTHSRDVMRLADKVVVLSGGVKVDEGSYEALARKRGPFAELISGGRWAAGAADDERDLADGKWPRMDSWP